MPNIKLTFFKWPELGPPTIPGWITDALCAVSHISVSQSRYNLKERTPRGTNPCVDDRLRHGGQNTDARTLLWRVLHNWVRDTRWGILTKSRGKVTLCQALNREVWTLLLPVKNRYGRSWLLVYRKSTSEYKICWSKAPNSQWLRCPNIIALIWRIFIRLG